ncbi:hypothetical protein Q8W71_20115 [Methylobacterium sp. NEAU 140]|uniref:hypothetical protein n=1 Tax=Methylobacterium sp. NEAU 140 TaxID=3064945 RepID=UPI00273410DB|nr:hypothetical protein [Methylobacterium sp. NEAU 140]MDP4024940.1 hypothetical protein [Methylobacterium sp. NEAU 140]
MDWKRVALGAGGVCAFVVAVAAGAVAIVGLMPGERPAAFGEKALLMESAPALKPFDEPRKPPVAAPPAPITAPPAQGALAERPPATRPGPRPAAARPTPEEVLAEWHNTPAGAPATTDAPAPIPAVPAERREPRREAAVAALVPPAPAARPPAVPAPPLPALRAPPEPHVEGMITASEIRRMRLSLRLTREQEPHWAPVEQVLLEIGAQQAAMVRAGQNPKDAFGVGAAMRIYGIARPLLDTLRDDQKAVVRARARAMGFGNVASNI